MPRTKTLLEAAKEIYTGQLAQELTRVPRISDLFWTEPNVWEDFKWVGFRYVRKIKPGQKYRGPNHRKEFERMSRSVQIPQARVESVFIKDDALHLVFETGEHFAWSDAGQSCCERRYMTCDDDLASFTGDTFISWVLETVPENKLEDYSDVHEIQFLKLQFKSGNVITACTHNEHNGYYGGFAVQVCEVKS